MNDVIKATEARKNWSKVIDEVVHKKPIFIKRRRDKIALFSLEQLDLILDIFKLDLKILSEEDGSYTGTIKEIDILGNADSTDELINLMCDNLIEYANEYMDNFNMYYSSKNRRVHFPYIYKVIAHEFEKEKIKEMFNIINKDQNDA